MRALLAGVLLIGLGLSASCMHGVHRSQATQTWRPEEKDAPAHPRILAAAFLLTTTSDIDVINRAGATLIGWHDARGGFAMRAAMSGGTHFAAVLEQTPANRSACYSWGDTALCPAPYKASYWTRIAVFRLTPDRWHALPVHLIPTDGDVMGGAPASALRSGCRGVHPSYGVVRCDRGWKVVTNRTVAANIPPVVPTEGGPDVSGPRGPMPGEPDAPFDEVDGP